MTQQYLVGEMSLLSQLQAVAPNNACGRNAAHLRHEAESGPITRIPSVAVRALVLADGLCWDSLDRGDISAFVRQAAFCAELHEFGACASLLGEE
jgi:hypothetical protein